MKVEAEHRKYYDEEKHKKYERGVRKSFIELFENNKNIKVIKEKEKFKYDMRVKNLQKDKFYLLEFETREIKHFNKIKNRTYPSVHIPLRKLINGNKADIYIISNLDCSEFFITYMRHIKEAFKNGDIDKNIFSRSGRNNEQELDSFVCVKHNKFKHFQVLKNKKGEAKKVIKI